MSRARTHVVSLYKMAALTKFVRPSAIHAHSFYITDPHKLDADIIAAIQLISKLDQLMGGHLGIFQVIDDVADLSLGDGAVEAIGTEQQRVAGENLRVGGINVNKEVGADRPAQ